MSNPHSRKAKQAAIIAARPADYAEKKAAALKEAEQKLVVPKESKVTKHEVGALGKLYGAVEKSGQAIEDRAAAQKEAVAAKVREGQKIAEKTASAASAKKMRASNKMNPVDQGANVIKAGRQAASALKGVDLQGIVNVKDKENRAPNKPAMSAAMQKRMVAFQK